MVFAGAAALDEAKVLVEALVLAEAEVFVEGVVELGGRDDAGEDLVDLFVQVGILEGGALRLQYSRGHPNNLSVSMELDIGGVVEDAELDALAKPVLVNEDTPEVGAGLYRNISQSLLSHLLFPLPPFFLLTEKVLLLICLLLRFSAKTGFLHFSSNAFSNSIFIHLIFFSRMNSSCFFGN